MVYKLKHPFRAGIEFGEVKSGGQQGFDILYGLGLGLLHEHMTQISVRLQPIRDGGLDKRIQGGADVRTDDGI